MSVPGRESDVNARSGAPFVTHIATTPRDLPGRDAIEVSLDLVTAELRPLAASFFGISDGEIHSSVVAGSHLPPRRLAGAVEGWKVRLNGLDPLAPPRIAGLSARIATPRDVEQACRRHGSAPSTKVYRLIGAVNDVRMLVRDGSRLIGGVTLWRRFGQSPWAPGSLRLLAALQPLVETAYLGSLSVGAGGENPLPATLTRRQRQVARLLAGGASNAEVACALQISPNTVNSHARSVLAALGASSRRELALRYAPRSSAVLTVPSPRRRGQLAASVEGDDPARRVLAAALDWSVERLGAKAAGCVVLSARRRPASGASSSLLAAPDPASPSPARRIQELMLAPARLAAMIRAADDPSAPAILPEDPRPEADEEARLLARAGFGRPVVAALRRNGRIAALIWFCGEADADSADAEAALRAAHPLLQIALQGALSAFGDDSPWLPTVGDRGLTAREVAVARRALDGESNARIASRLGISVSTVKKHMTRILTKCDVRSRTQLIALLGDDRRELDETLP